MAGRAARLEAVQQGFLAAAARKGIALQVRCRYSHLFNGMAVQVTPAQRARMAALPNVKGVYPDHIYKADLTDNISLIGAPNVWAMTDGNGQAVTGQGIKVAVVDMGIDWTRPDLGGCLGPQCKVIGGYDFIHNTSTPMDDYGHGTHVAGIIAANGTLKGVAPNAELLAYKVLDNTGSGTDETVIADVEQAVADGASVINLSLGGSGTPDDPLSQAVDQAVDDGVVVTVAAGNSGPGGMTLGSPGVALMALTVVSVMGR